MVALTVKSGDEEVAASIADTAEPDESDGNEKSESEASGSDGNDPNDGEYENIPGIKNENKNLLSHFWNLASLDESVRSNSVVSLLNELKKTGKVEDINYTTQRLVKGLSSSRKAARQGFATALTHLMNEFSEVEVSSEEVIELMEKHLTVQGSFKGQEERDAYFGQLFGFLAISRSKLQGGGDNSKVDCGLVKKLIQNLLILMNKKSYLQEICGIAICDILKAINFLTFETIKPILESILCKGWEKCSPEDLLIVLTIQSKFKDDLPKKFFKDHWHRSEILHKANFKDMTRVLMDTTNNAHPRVHTLWDVIVQYLLSHEDDDTLGQFWKIVAVDGLMQSTHERKFLVMNVILKMAPKLRADQIQIVFGEIIIRCIINSCQSKMNYLYSCVQNMLGKLPDALSKNGDKDVVSCVIKSLVGCHGHVGFDSITKTKVVDELSMKLSHNLSAYFNWLKAVFFAGMTNLVEDPTVEHHERDVDECRGWVGNQLISLFRIAKVKKEESLLMDITTFLFFHGYFDAVKKHKTVEFLQCLPAHSVSDSTHQFFRQRFNTALSELANFHGKLVVEGKSSIGGVAEDGEWFAWKVLCFAKSLVEIPKYVQLVLAWTPEVHDSWLHSIEKISTMKVEGTKSESTVNSKGAQLLFIHATLQLFLNREEAVDILKELETCYKKAAEKKRKKKTEPHWTEVLTEILLGFMAQSSHLLRQVVDVVYPTIIPHLTQDALDLLLKAIKPIKQNDADGIEFENESDMDEMENHEEEISNEAGDAEEKDEDIDANDDQDDESGTGNKNVGDKSGTDSEESGSSEESEESDFEVDEEFKTELKAALGDSAIQSDEDDEDDEEGEDEEDIDMDTCDPNQLKIMDQALADVFKSRKQKKIEKKKKKDKKLSILHFKLRVLDLIEIFIKQQPKDPKILLLIEPLYEVVKSSHGHSDEQPLFERTLGIFKNKLCNLHEYPSGKDLDIKCVHVQIDRLIDLARSATSALLVGYITQGIIYLIRVLRGNPEIKGPSPRTTRAKRKEKEASKDLKKPVNVGCLDEEHLVECFKTVLLEFMTKKSSHLQPVLFMELIQRFPSLGWKLAIELPQYLNNGCNNFRKVKSFEMLKLLFSKKTDKHEDNIMAINESMGINIIEAFQATKLENYSLKARQFHHIVQLASIYIKETSKYPKVLKKVDIKGIQAAVTEALDSPVVKRSASLQSYCKSLLSTLSNAGLPNKKKRKCK